MFCFAMSEQLLLLDLTLEVIIPKYRYAKVIKISFIRIVINACVLELITRTLNLDNQEQRKHSLLSELISMSQDCLVRNLSVRETNMPSQCCWWWCVHDEVQVYVERPRSIGCDHNQMHIIKCKKINTWVIFDFKRYFDVKRKLVVIG